MPQSKGDDTSSRLAHSIRTISRTAKELNNKTDRLNEAVEKVELALKPLNLGISTWLQVSVHEEGPLWEIEEIGYGKIRGKWCVGLRKSSGDTNYEERDEETEWPFAEGPRDLRIRGASLLPMLIERLHADAEAAVEAVVLKTQKALEIAAALTANGDSKEVE